MPSLTDLTARQRTRLQEAVDSHNARSLDSMSVDQWVWSVVRARILTEVASAYVDTTRESLLSAAKRDLD